MRLKSILSQFFGAILTTQKSVADSIMNDLEVVWYFVIIASFTKPDFWGRTRREEHAVVLFRRFLTERKPSILGTCHQAHALISSLNRWCIVCLRSCLMGTGSVDKTLLNEIADHFMLIFLCKTNRWHIPHLTETHFRTSLGTGQIVCTCLKLWKLY